MKTLLLDGALTAIIGKCQVEKSCILDLRKEIEVLSKKINLDERELFIIENRFKNRLTLDSIGKILGGISRERVRQLEFRIGKKIKKHLIKNGQTHILSFKIDV